jgi:cobalt-zinc-cadmium efflux system outer membrane protein
MHRYYVALWACGLLGAVHAIAQPDTLRISLSNAEQRCLANNPQLAAGRRTIDAARAAEQQAGLWNNPTLSLEQNIYNQFTGKWFDLGAGGNTGIQIQQQFPLAGKRGKQVRLAEMNTQITALSRDDLVRTLRLNVRSSLYDLHFLTAALAMYDESIDRKSVV